MRANDAFCAVAALAASQHGVCSRQQAANIGIDAQTIRRMKRLELVSEPAWGALVLAGSVQSWRQRLMVATTAGPGVAVASGAAAAALHRLDGCGEGALEVTIPRSSSLRLPGVVVHRVTDLPPRDVTVVDGIRCTGIARTLVDLGGRVGSRQVLQAVDDARRRGVNPLWLSSTAERLHGPGRKSPGILLHALARSADGQAVPESWFERLLHEALSCPDLPPLVRQYEIRAASGSLLARVDLAVPDLRLGIEGHSRQFHFGSRAEQLDEDRDLAVAGEGWQLLYLGWQATVAPKAALRKIRHAVHARRALLGIWESERVKLDAL